jgi:methionine-rich copper-binding protein CopC
MKRANPRLPVRLVPALLLSVLVTGLGVGSASAHSELVSSDPADGERLARTPTELRLTFSDDIVANFAQVSLRRAGEPARRLRLRVDGVTVTAAVPPTSSTTPRRTTWSVAYRVVSEDGHPISGRLGFSVPASSVQPVTPTPQPSDSPSARDARQDEAVDHQKGGRFPLWPLLVVGGMAAAVFVLGARRLVDSWRR